MTRRRTNDLAVRGKAVPLARFVRDDAGGVAAEFTDSNDPAAMLEAKEERELADRESAHADGREDVLELLMSYLFSGDPHPAHVLRRLWLALGELAPHLQAGIQIHEAALLRDPSEIGHAWRVRLLVRGTRFARRLPSAHDAIVRGVLASAYSRRPGLELVHQVPLDTLTRLHAGETVAQFGARQEAMLVLLQFIFVTAPPRGSCETPRPEAVLRQVFLIGKALTPHLILHMSLQNLGDMFGQQRATWSSRGKRRLTAFLAARGAKGCHASYQKSAEACATYAVAQRGNRNRIGLPRRVA
jgi:hypothetical protein